MHKKRSIEFQHNCTGAEKVSIWCRPRSVANLGEINRVLCQSVFFEKKTCDSLL